MASTTYAYSSQSKSWISGVPHVANPSTNAEDILKTMVAAALHDGNQRLREDMKRDPQWRPFLDNVEINWNGSELAVSIVGTDEEIAAIQILEYGDTETQADPLLSRTAFRLQDWLNKGLEEAVGEAMRLG